MVAPGSGGGNGFDADLRAEGRRLRGCGGSAGGRWLWPSRAEGSRGEQREGEPPAPGKAFPGVWLLPPAEGRELGRVSPGHPGV